MMRWVDQGDACAVMPQVELREFFDEFGVHYDRYEVNTTALMII